ncbi:hypothetical protein VNI00_000944 [Paramarasmius palmivorus]|uniref:Uncharacterized protein n=1 Tax=Paramarasmius palmivorus TaxID=297713 RepID=A0AAW0E8Q3_9AGAR
MPPTFYDPNSPEEQEVPLPSAPLVQLSENVVMQPPLTRRGTGPGIFAFLPADNNLGTRKSRSLDPEPIQKWAEEGFAVVGITGARTSADVDGALSKGLEALLGLKEMDTKDKFAVYVYDSKVLSIVIESMQKDSRLAGLVAIASEPPLSPTPPVPSFIHLATTSGQPQASSSSPSMTLHRYTNASSNFILPYSADYNPGYASLAHSRTLVFLRKTLGGPIFDIEAIWEEHTYFEFEVRSVAKTMGTMVAEPYVNHVPTMTGGIGRENLTAFYRDHFIFANPPDTELQLVSRTVGSDRVIDEFIFKLTHDRVVDWLLPGVPPTGKKLEIPFVGVVNSTSGGIKQARYFRQGFFLVIFLTVAKARN